MRNSVFLILSVAAMGVAQHSAPANCTGVGRDIDVRCACVKDPSSKLCDMVKAGFYDPDRNKQMLKQMPLAWPGILGARPASAGIRPSTTAAGRQPVPQRRPQQLQQQARVVPLAHKDFGRALQPNAQLAAGVDLGKLMRSPEIIGALFGSESGNKVAAALQEVEQLWLSIGPPNDVVIVMTGKFEKGAMAGLFYSQGVMPVFLGGANAMLIGPEASVQAALARLAKAPAPAELGWTAKRARELAKDHETWIVGEKPSGAVEAGSPLDSVRKFALGLRMTDQPGVDGEVVADSEAGAAAVAAWVNRMKETFVARAGVDAKGWDALQLEPAGATLRFRVAGDGFMRGGESGKTSAMSTDFGVELHRLLMGGIPGAPSRTVPEEKLLAVKEGMKREDVLHLVGPPLSVTSIQGLELPRETWVYQVPFGKQYSVRLDGGAVSRPPGVNN
jgi:hypothetical protein